MTKKSRESGKELSFEERLTRLQAIVSTLESGESPLEESVALYKEGLAHTKACRDQLARARHEIEIYQNGDCKPFEAEAPGDLQNEPSINDLLFGDMDSANGQGHDR